MSTQLVIILLFAVCTVLELISVILFTLISYLLSKANGVLFFMTG